MSLAISSKGKGKKRRTNTRVWFWVDECRYSVIVDNVKGLGWKLVDEERHESKSNMYWIDVAAIHERFRSIQAWQTINHFPGMPNIARKNRMGQNLNRMLKMFPREYSFYPRTWVLPGINGDPKAAIISHSLHLQPFLAHLVLSGYGFSEAMNCNRQLQISLFTFL
jgi:Tubulin-tyrosine ligase family